MLRPASGNKLSHTGAIDEQAQSQVAVGGGGPGWTGRGRRAGPHSRPGAANLPGRDFPQPAAAGSRAVAGGVTVAPPAPAAAEPAEPERPGAVPVTLQVNGKKHELKLDPRVTLLDALR